MQKAVVYLRVSSIKQEDGYSLDAQEKMALEYIQRHNLQLAKSIWKVQESAWGANQLPVPHFYPNPAKKIAFPLC